MIETDVVAITGFDAAIIGVGRRCGQPDILAYDVSKVIAILMTDHGMSQDDAVEYYEFNIVGAWVGDQTPLFVHVERNDHA